eukprot:1811939-Pyramimonas_sp.AAC.1
MLKLALILPLDKVYALHRTVMPMGVVDDLLLQRVGGRGRVCREIVQATKDLQRILAEHDLHVHSDKTCVLSNDAMARGLIAGQLARATGAIAVRHERNLGVDCAAGRRIHRHVRSSKVAQARVKVRRVKKFWTGTKKRLVAARIARAGIEASYSYGMPVTGCSAGELESARALAFSAIEPRTSGKSRTLTFMCHGKVGPLYRATLLPIVAFVRAIWESW